MRPRDFSSTATNPGARRIGGKSSGEVKPHRVEMDRMAATIRNDRAHDRSSIANLDASGKPDAVFLEAIVIERQIQRARVAVIAISQLDPVVRHRV